MKRLALIGLLLIAGCGGGTTVTNTQQPIPTHSTPTPSGVASSSCTTATLGQPGCTIPKPNACHARASGALPDPACTPGAVNARYVGNYLFCQPGYRTGTDRPPTTYTGPLKLKLLAAYGIPASQVKNYELDHLIPLTAGGAPAAPANLWPETWTGAQGAKVKDQAELKLHKTVCGPRAGDASLLQGAFAVDWRSTKP